MTEDTKAFFRRLISEKSKFVEQLKYNIAEDNMILRDTKRELFRLQGDEHRKERDEDDTLLHITRMKLKHDNVNLKININIIKDLQRLLDGDRISFQK